VKTDISQLKTTLKSRSQRGKKSRNKRISKNPKSW